jgi:Mg2+/citrate symporter
VSLLLLAQYSWRPFINQPPLWDVWYLLILPLCAAVAIVYKCVKCQRVEQVPREAAQIFMWILVAMIAAAGVLAGVVWVMGR